MIDRSANKKAHPSKRPKPASKNQVEPVQTKHTSRKDLKKSQQEYTSRSVMVCPL